MGVVGLAEYVCTHPILNFYRGGPRLCSRGHRVGVTLCTQPCLWIRDTYRRFRIAQDSDDPLFVVNVVVWVLVVILTIVRFTTHFCVELYGDVPSDVIKVLSAS